MLNMPILKFEKSTNYLNEQLDIQLNNKQLVADIISNIGLILDGISEEDEKTNYLNIQKSANTFLQTISQNITTIEELNREIKHITYDLTEVLSEANRKEKSKEYYIAAISSVKNNIENYTFKFQNFEQKLEHDNIDFNEFINTNNFKYNFISDKNSDSYEFSGFSIDNQVIQNTVNDEEPQPEEVIINEKEAKINELTNEFKSMLSNLSEDTILNLDLITSLKNEFQNVSTVEESSLEEDIKTEVSKENLSNTTEEESVLIEEELSPKVESSEITNTEEETPNIIIDYSSIYGNYYKNASTIEENILSEYSSFSPSTPQENKAPAEPLFILEEEKDEDENLEITDEDLLSEILEEELSKSDIESNIAINDNNDILINDETLTEEEITQIDETSLLDSISDDDILAELLISDTSTNDLISEVKIADNEEIKEEPIKEKPTKINHNNFSDYNLEEKIKIIKEAATNNDSLIISEKQNKVFLPYTIDELEKYLKSYPEVYTSLVDVVEQEFILPFDTFFKHPAKSRFSETYNLIRNRQGKSIFSAIIYGAKLIGRYNLNPAIIAACKTEQQLDSYLYYLNLNDLSKFNSFKVIYEINPL